jgi:hypothetical protein
VAVWVAVWVVVWVVVWEDLCMRAFRSASTWSTVLMEFEVFGGSRYQINGDGFQRSGRI